jgi:hypothetical protein
MLRRDGTGVCRFDDDGVAHASEGQRDHKVYRAIGCCLHALPGGKRKSRG